MANRYWVGGAGTWNTTSTTNWSTSSGGSGGAPVPTAADSVFFDQAGTYTVTCSVALFCLDITVSAGTVTFSSNGTLTISGSMSLLAGTVWSATGTITFNATTTGKTVTTNGVSLNGNIIFNGAGGGWTLGSALTSTGSLTVTNGTFSTSVSNYAVTALAIDSSFGTNRTISLNASTVTFTAAVTVVNFTVAINLTFNAGTSTIICTGSPITFIGGGLTFYNVSFTSTTVGTRSITGANTFNNLSVAAPSAIGVTNLGFAANQTINGALTTTGTAGNRRVWISSTTYGIGWTLTCNSAASLTDADFRDIYVIGTAAPISGTRIGNRGNCSGITFSTPKTVYWNLAGAQNWSANGWATTSTGTPSTDNFPLPQDTATFTNAGSVTGTITFDSAITFKSSVDMSARTTAMTLAFTNATTLYGNWKNGSGTTLSGTATITFSGDSTKTITSASKTFSCPIAIDAYGGTVQLADALNISTNALTVTNGTFTTAGFAVTAGQLSSSNSNVRTINLGASAVSFSASATPINISSTNLTFNAGTSTITSNSSNSSFTITGGLTFYNVTFASTATIPSISGANTFNNLTITGRTTVGLSQLSISGNQTINGTLTVSAGTASAYRTFLKSDTIGTTRTLTCAAVSLTDTDFRDITIAGAASPASGTRLGNCGGNTNITFPAAKTVYYRQTASGNNWGAIGSGSWSATSGGALDATQFPLAQDTAIFPAATYPASGSTVIMNALYNVGTIDMSLRTANTMTFSTSTAPTIYGNWINGTGITLSGAVSMGFRGRTTQQITSAGITFPQSLIFDTVTGTVQLADAFTASSGVTTTLTSGTFDAVSYNVTTGLFSAVASATLKMGSGTWTLSGTGTVWDINSSTPPTLYAGTSNIVLSDTSVSDKIFNSSDSYYNKITIAGGAGTGNVYIQNTNSFGFVAIGELASTRTSAFSLVFTQNKYTYIGKWSVTGSLGKVVSVISSGASQTYVEIYGPAVTGVDYLSLTNIYFLDSSGEFFAGANSTNGGGNFGPVFFTAAPAPRTLYWVGGTGNWSSTTKWSTSSGGASGAAIPTSLDSVVFNSASNATAYTATIDAGIVQARCASFTMSGPAAGNVNFTGATALSINGNFSLSATGITRNYSGFMYLVGNSSYTFTTNGISLAANIYIRGMASTWTLGSALTVGSSSVNFTYGSFDTSVSGYAINAYSLTLDNLSSNSTVSLQSSTVTLTSSTPIDFLINATSNIAPNFVFNCGTSQINCSATAINIYGKQTFYNVAFTSNSNGGGGIYGNNVFNNLSITGRALSGLNEISFDGNITINGSLTLSAGSGANSRAFIKSSAIGTTRTFAVASFTAGASDIDFRDIAVTGTAAPLTGTRFGDCKGNSGITFPAAKTVYYRSTSSANWSTSWSATSGGASDATQFPLAQDIAVFPAATYPASGSTTTINDNYNIGTIDMSLRTSNTMTLATGSTTPSIYGNWINGTGTVLSGSDVLTFAGRGSQTITSAGKTFTQTFTINTPNGSVTLQDAFVTDVSAFFTLTAGSFDASTYNFSLSSGFSSFTASGSTTRTLAIGSGTWTIAGVGSTAWSTSVSTNLTVTGTGTISLTNASAKTFAGGGLSYSGITLNQGGAGTLSITGNNTFANITNTYAGATTINLAATTQTVGAWTAKGTAGNLLTITGTSVASPATLIYTGVGSLSGVGYLVPTFVRAYPTTTTWSIKDSTNGGSLGFVFTYTPIATATGNFFLMF